MVEYQLVPAPTFFPNACFCGSQQHPIVDTAIEVEGRRIYVCRLCAKRVAAAFGFAKGEKMDELENAVVALEERDRQIEELQRLTRELTDSLAEAQARDQTKSDYIEQLQSDIATRKHLLGQLVTTAQEAAAV